MGKPKAAVSSMLAALTMNPIPPSSTRSYDRFTKTCKNAIHVSNRLSVGSVAECKKLCDKHSGCTSLDTNGVYCFFKSHCEGQVGQCSGWCGYRVKTSQDV